MFNCHLIETIVKSGLIETIVKSAVLVTSQLTFNQPIER